MVDSWYYVEKYQRKRVAGYCYQRPRQTNFFQEKIRQMFLNWMLQSKEFNPENFNTSAINLKRHALKQELHGGNHGEISA